MYVIFLDDIKSIQMRHGRFFEIPSDYCFCCPIPLYFRKKKKSNKIVQFNVTEYKDTTSTTPKERNMKYFPSRILQQDVS